MSEPEEQVLIVNLSFSPDDIELVYELEDLLEKLLSSSGIGEYDGNEIDVARGAAPITGTFYMYGPDANKIFNLVCPIVAEAEFVKSATATRQYGGPDSYKGSTVAIK